jgi:protein transport protein SEC61 subunit alpha
MIHFLLTKPTRTALYLSLTRTSAPNLCSFLGTVLIFFIVIYLQGVKMQIPLIHQHSRGFKYNFKVKLFFTSTISIILQSMFSSKIYGLSQVLHQRFKNISLVNWLGVW